MAIASMTDVRIANLALSYIGSKTNIESFDEESTEARNAALWYDIARQQALEAYDWSFARKRLTLALHGTDPSDEWDFRYQYPSDCICARYLVNPVGDTADPVPYTLEMVNNTERTLLTDLQDAALVYTFDQTSTAVMPMLFIQFFAHLLASHLVIPLSMDKEIMDMQLKLADKVLWGASAVDANQHKPRHPREAEWYRGR